MIEIVLLGEGVEAVVERFEEGALSLQRALLGLLSGLHFYGRGGVFEAEQERAGVFEVLGLEHVRAVESGCIPGMSVKF